MSAAEPAPPTPSNPTVNTGEGAAVLDFTKHRTHRDHRPTSRGWNTMGTPPTNPPTPEPAGLEAALARVAEDMEKELNAIGRTLTDDETAKVFVRTLTLVEHALKGAVVNGIIGEEQRRELGILIGGMKEAPRLV